MPLILAFFCILGGSQPLPEFRSDLYGKVLSRMLDGYWHNIAHPPGQPPLDKEACLRTLRDWAWSGALAQPSGIGIWADEVQVKPVWLGQLAASALDHIATALDRGDDDTELIKRRFIHRSVREYLVAEHVALLPADQAAETLLPHLWYDLDWENPAPMALAMHPQRDQLLQTLISQASRADQIPGDLSVIDAGGEFRRFLARAAAESSEDAWRPEIAAIIGQARIDMARSGDMSGLGWAVHWETSNRQARDELITQLAGQADARTAAELAGRLIQLNPTTEDSSQARQVLVGLLARLTSWPAGDLVDAVVRLAVAADDEQQARQALSELMNSQDNPSLAAELARE